MNDRKHKLETLRKDLQPRLRRAKYLRSKAESTIRINPEQAEAYIERLRWQKGKIIELAQKISRLEDGIDLIA